MAEPPYKIEFGIPIPQPVFPGGSKSQVTRAGEALRRGVASAEDLQTIDAWRAAHRNVLNTFQAILRTRTRDTDVVVAQRHKRKRTIFGKLTRYPTMALARMDDVAGCRLIFPDVEALYHFRDSFHHANFRHRLRNEADKWDYIKKPKTSGYRGIHDVYEYDVNSERGRDFKGLLLEIQYRTKAQHAWATCVEVVGFITESQPKFQQGDVRYQVIMAYASELIARFAEHKTSCFPDLSNRDLASRFLALDQELGLLKLLRGLHSGDANLSTKKNMILIFSEERLQVKMYRRTTEALQALFRFEQETPGKDIVLVQADKSEDVRDAFRNYFSDAREFITLVDEACAQLAKG